MKRINIYSLKQVKEKGALYDLPTKKITSPETAYQLIEGVLQLSDEPVEKFGIVTLNTKNDVAGFHVLHVGDLNSSIVSIRSIFQTALLNNACSILAFHNHPSGCPSPSREDIDMTRRIKEAGNILKVELLDHIIVGEERFISLKEKGLI